MHPQKGQRAVEALAAGMDATAAPVVHSAAALTTAERLDLLRGLFARTFTFFVGASVGMMAIYAAYLAVGFNQPEGFSVACLRVDQAVGIVLLLVLVLAGERVAVLAVGLRDARDAGSASAAAPLLSSLKRWAVVFTLFALAYLVQLVNHRLMMGLSAAHPSPGSSVTRTVYTALQAAIAGCCAAAWVFLSCWGPAPAML